MRTLRSVAFYVLLAAAARVADCRPLRWTLQNVTLQPGAGTLSGSFNYDAITNTYIDWSILVQGAGAFGIVAETFTPSNSSLIIGTAFFFSIRDATTNQYLTLSFGAVTPTPLTEAGGTIILSTGSSVRNGQNAEDDVFNAAPPLASVTAPGTTSNLSQIAVFRPLSAAPNSLAEWIEDSNGNNAFEATDKVRIFGLSGLPGSTLPDVAVVGDFFGTGATQNGVFRCPAIGLPGLCQWYIDANNNGRWDGLFGGDALWNFGLPGDIPIVGDWTGSGTAKIGIMRCPASGVCTWYLDIGNRHTYDPATVGTYLFGLPGDTPVVSNWSGIAQVAPVDNIGVFRCPASGVCTWIVDSLGITGVSTVVPVGAFSPSDAQYFFGLTGDTPVIGNWSGTGQKRIGIFRPNSPSAGLSQWFVDTNGDHTYTPALDQIFTYGLTGDQPVVGFFTN
jgi:hypothetical protein